MGATWESCEPLEAEQFEFRKASSTRVGNAEHRAGAEPPAPRFREADLLAKRNFDDANARFNPGSVSCHGPRGVHFDFHQA